ncbi:MAG: T9SS type A sorting domain-containing protein, partial [Candidatus Saccharimonadales bacterium]
YNVGVDYDGTFSLRPGTGIMVFYRGNLSNIGTKFTPGTSAESTVLMSTGTLNQQTVTVTNWYTGLTTLQYDVIAGNKPNYQGYNLVGNPYASSIDWNTFSSTNSSAGIYGPNVNPTIYIFNVASKSYATYSGGVGTNGGTNIIPSGQGFFVKASSSSAQLIFHESAKTTAQLTGPTQSTGTTLLLSTAPVPTNTIQYLRLQLAADSVDKEETIIRFNNSAKNAYDINEDSQYLPGSGLVNFSSMTADTVKTAINVIPFPKTSKTINLNVICNADGRYTLSMTEIKSIPQIFDVWLMDAHNKDSLDMRHNETYAFDVTKSDTSTSGFHRFSLVIRQDPALAVHLLSFGAAKATDGAQIEWTTENEQNYTNFSVERSSDGGVTFTGLGSLASSAQGAYSFLDKDPPLSTDLYRLQITDLNGTVSYSNIVSLIYGDASPEAKNSAINIYPNPATSIVNLSVNQPNSAAGGKLALQATGTMPGAPITDSAPQAYDIKIINITGSVVKSATSANANWQANVGSLLPGTYIIQVVNDKDKTLVGKGAFIKM